MIVSIQNHCSVEQQIIAAKYMRTVFGDKLLTNFDDVRDSTSQPHDVSSHAQPQLQQLPSPEQLKGRILIKVGVAQSLVRYNQANIKHNFLAC